MQWYTFMSSYMLMTNIYEDAKIKNLLSSIFKKVQSHNYSWICVGSDIFLHRDKNLMPQNPAAWSAWNFLGSNNNKVCLTYWINILQVGKFSYKSIDHK